MQHNHARGAYRLRRWQQQQSQQRRRDPDSYGNACLFSSCPEIYLGAERDPLRLDADGNGNITFTTNRSTSSGLVQYQKVTGTYQAVGSNGRIEVTTPDGLTRIIYIVSPTKIIYLSNDTGGYVGVFEQ